MRAHVRLLLPDGQYAELGHGDIIGRLWSAALSLQDGRISEAHAMVSLRGQELLLLALRGRFTVDGRAATSVVLEHGQRIAVAEDLELLVEEVELPTKVLAIEGDGLPRQVLGGVCSLLTRPRPELVPRFVNASAHIWTDGDRWLLRVGDQVRPLSPGDAWEVDGRAFRAVAASLSTAGRTATRLDGGLQRPVRILARFDTAHLFPEGGAPLALSGRSARLLSELVAFAQPVSWLVLAQELWPEEEEPNQLRRRLDVTLSRLRRKLREAGIRPDLIRADGFGHFELFLHDGDRVEDET